MMLRYLLALFLFAAWSLAPAAGYAQSGDGAMAQSLFDQAKELLASGQAAQACPMLEESQRLEPKSGTLLNLARCYEQTGRLASAWSKYLEAATAAKAAGNPEREAVARERAQALGPRLSKLVIAVPPSLGRLRGLQVTRDGVVVGGPAWGVALPLDSGEHQVAAKAAGYEPFETKVTIEGEGKTATVRVPELRALAPSPDTHGSQASHAVRTEQAASKQNGGLGSVRVAALVAGGVGVVGVGLGSAFGLVSKSKHDEAARYCSGAACTDPRGVTAGDAAQINGNFSTAAMIVGGVGLAAGVTLWFAAPPRAGNARKPQVGLGVGSLHVKGSF